MKAYVSEGIQRKEFSWGVPVPDSKHLIDADDPSYTWQAPDTSKWCASQVVEIVHATKLQYGLLSGVADPSKTLLHAAHPALCLKGADGWRDVVLRPDRTFEKSVAAFNGSTYKKTFERTSKSLSVGGGIFGLFSSHVKRTLDRQKGSIRKSEEFSIVTKVSCYGCELNLANHLAIRPEVEDEFAAVCDDNEMNRIQKHAKINGLFEKYGAFYVRGCQLGVQATGTNTLTSKFSFNAEELASTLETGCSFRLLFGGACAAKREFSGSSELQETAMDVSEHLNVSVIGATIAPGLKSLTSIASSAGDPRQWAVLDISEIVPLTELFAPELQEKVNDLVAQPWCCKVVEMKSARSNNPSVTVTAADIEKQLQDKGYTVIGGGARVGSGGLVESRPTYDAESRTTGWSAKSHSSNEVLTAYAICLKPNDSSIELDAKVATATDPGSPGDQSIKLTQFQAQRPGYTLVSGGGKCEFSSYHKVLTASSPTGNEATVDGWEVKANKYESSPSWGSLTTFVYVIMLKNIAGFEYRVRRHRSVSGVSDDPHVEDCPELTTQIVCGGGAKLERWGRLKVSSPIIDGRTGAPIGWAAACYQGTQGSVEAYTVSLDIVPSV